MVKLQRVSSAALRIKFTKLTTFSRLDFDPEDIGNGRASDSDSDGSIESDDGQARTHYEAVGKSKLRKPREQELGPQYAGAKVSRDALNQSDEDDFGNNGSGSDEETGSFGETDEEFEQGSGEEDFDDAENSLDADDHEDVSESDVPQPLGRSNGISSKTAALADVVQQTQQTAVQSLAQAAQTDVEKGNAVKKQRSTFNALLNTRMRLQKGLVTANTLPTISNANIVSATDREIIESAEKAALSLLNRISAMRTSLAGTKRHFSATLETSTADIHSHMQSLEASNATDRKAILTRWAQKTQATTATLPKVSKLRETPAASQQPFVDMLDSQLSVSNMARLVSRSRTPRSCAPVQAEASKDEDSAVYDDADWYALLLRDLVESKMGESGVSTGDRGADGAMPTAAAVDALRRQAKTHRANVDVKASKGRKLRYTVQEKIQNFMAPEDRTTWEDQQVTKLFGSLLGKRVAGGLDEDVEMEEEDHEDEDAEAEPLRLFAG